MVKFAVDWRDAPKDIVYYIVCDGWVDLTRTEVSGETPSDPSMSFSLTNLPQGFSSPYTSRSLPVWNKWSIGVSVIPLTHAQETSTYTRNLSIFWCTLVHVFLYKLARNRAAFYWCEKVWRNSTTTRAGNSRRKARQTCKFVVEVVCCAIFLCQFVPGILRQF